MKWGRRRRGGQVGRRKQKVRSSPCVSCEWKLDEERRRRGLGRGGVSEGGERVTAAMCEANEERAGSRDRASDSHVLHRR